MHGCRRACIRGPRGRKLYRGIAQHTRRLLTHLIAKLSRLCRRRAAAALLQHVMHVGVVQFASQLCSRVQVAYTPRPRVLTINTRPLGG